MGRGNPKLRGQNFRDKQNYTLLPTLNKLYNVLITLFIAFESTPISRESEFLGNIDLTDNSDQLCNHL
jgi:hypothetical protein